MKVSYALCSKLITRADRVGCELLPKGCNVDQRSFKAYLARWMAATTKLVPWTKNEIMNLIQKSAIAAVKTCTATVGSRAYVLFLLFVYV